MTKRKAIPVRVHVSVAIRQAREGAQSGCEYFPCGICRKPLHEDEPRILEHMVPHATRLALGLDPDAPEILAFVHEHCAAKKTNGTKATTAGSDKHMIAKGKRLEKAREAHRAVLAGERTREPGKIRSRGFPKVKRPMQSRRWK